MQKKIMIVDDSASIRMLTAFTLKNAGYEVVEAVDGNDALGKLNGQKISLFISDINMPGMDGLRFVGELKKNPAYKFTPVLMMTTESSQEKKQQGKDAGAKGWIVKPFVPQGLVDAVSKLAPLDM